MRLLIIDNYDSFTRNLVQLVEQVGNCDFFIRKNDRLQDLNRRQFDKVLISPGPGIASEAGDLIPFIKTHENNTPMLGVCLGFEALGQIRGAVLKRLPQPLHGYRNRGRVLNGNGIFKGLPSVFYIGHYHSWYFEKETFPAELIIDMTDEQDLIMAFHHARLPLTGVQFHPESIMTEHGAAMLKNWIEM